MGHPFIMTSVEQQIHRSKFCIVDFKFMALLSLNLNWAEVLVSAPIVKLEAL
jgi:hypothetical protein